jgi:hypothetical protein
MNLLWAFNFRPDIDVHGNPVPVDTWAYRKVVMSIGYLSNADHLVQGVSTGPLPFKCRITPRSAEKARIMEREILEAAATFSMFEVGLSEEDADFLAKSRVYVG